MLKSRNRVITLRQKCIHARILDIEHSLLDKEIEATKTVMPFMFPVGA